ncbi:MAG: HAMP domain-containing histidine kinase [Bacteroidia bacterium]|nr:HAMP domain-containing histidine kinase [Bacteroidia bacterium]
MNKPRLIFVFLSIYIIAAFSWWGFEHFRNSNNINLLEKEKSSLIVEADEVLCYKASSDIGEEIRQDNFLDTVQLNNYFRKYYSTLELIYVDTINPFNGYLIRPKEDAYVKLQRQIDASNNKLSKKKWMYATEGIVMIILLFWGILWVYRTFEKSIKLNQHQNNFLLSVTHELKTPIASVKLYLETLLKRDLDKEQQHIILRNSINDTNRLRVLVDNLLLSAQLETNHYEPLMTQINLSELLHKIIDKYAEPRNLQERIVKNIEHQVFITGDEFAIETIVINLLSNAEKYSDKNITILLKSDNKHVILSISDLGIGISDADKQRLFDKFYRVGEEQTRKTKGTGLGLFIVKKLVKIHHATIEVKNNHPNGTNFEVSFNV